MPTNNTSRIQNYEAKTEKPLMFLALVFVVSALVQVFIDSSSSLNAFFEFINWVIWFIYAVDYAVRIVLVDEKFKWILRHPLELAMVLLPLLRPLRLLRLVPVLVKLFRSGKISLAGRSLTLVAFGLLLVTIPASIAIFQIEFKEPNSHIQSGGDAIWWAITTVTTVGYGDTYPVTAAGRVISAFVMLLGISFIGILTAAVASWFVEQADDDLADKSDMARILERLEDLEKQISEIGKQKEN